MGPPLRERVPFLLMMGIYVAASLPTLPYGIDVGYRPRWVSSTGGSYYRCMIGYSDKVTIVKILLVCLVCKERLIY